MKYLRSAYKFYLKTTLLKWMLAKYWLQLVITYKYWNPNYCLIAVKVFHKDRWFYCI